MATHTITQTFNGHGVTAAKAIAKTVTGAVLIDGESVADGQTDKEIAFELDVSACKSFFLLSDQNVTFETNDGSTPADTISLVANVPYVYHDTDYTTFLLGTDVTAVFITNASGSAATITCVAGYDPTP